MPAAFRAGHCTAQAVRPARPLPYRRTGVSRRRASGGGGATGLVAHSDTRTRKQTACQLRWRDVCRRSVADIATRLINDPRPDPLGFPLFLEKWRRWLLFSLELEPAFHLNPDSLARTYIDARSEGPPLYSLEGASSQSGVVSSCDPWSFNLPVFGNKESHINKDCRFGRPHLRWESWHCEILYARWIDIWLMLHKKTNSNRVAEAEPRIVHSEKPWCTHNCKNNSIKKTPRSHDLV